MKIISKKILFIHIDKCGGSSIEEFLLNNDNNNIDLSKYNYLHLNYLTEEIKKKYDLDNGNQHKWLKDYENEINDNYFSFTIIRNPWARCVSEYLYRKQVISEFNKTFEEFINTLPKWTMYDRININGRLCDKIIKLEELDKEINEICNKFNFKNNLKKLNTLPKYNYKDFYNEKLKNKVYEHYKKDIETFNYSF